MSWYEILTIFSVFFLFLYYILNSFKWDKRRTRKDKIEKGKYYNKSVVYVGLVCVVLSFILALINRFTSGVLERSSGIKGFIAISGFYLIFIVFSIRDVIRIKNGYNEKLKEKNEEREDD